MACCGDTDCACGGECVMVVMMSVAVKTVVMSVVVLSVTVVSVMLVRLTIKRIQRLSHVQRTNTHVRSPDALHIFH